MKKFGVELGRLVKSKCGHDAENIYMIIKLDNDFVWLCDGDYKKLENPKKKRIKHVDLLEKISNTIAIKLKDGKIVHNEEIYSRIKQYKAKQKEGAEV